MNRQLIDIACPKCRGAMRPQERQGIVIDLCTECRGVFLDRGELDRLLDLEARTVTGYGGDRPGYGGDRPAYPGDDARRRDRDDDWDDDRRFDDRDDRQFDRPGSRDRGRGRRGGFLGDLFEGFGD